MVAVALLAAAGQMRPWVSPDTAGWLAATDLAGPRFPLYAVLAHVSAWIPRAALPWLQDGAFATAGWVLAAAVRWRGLSPEAVLAAGLAPLLSCVMLLWGRAVLPDVLSAAAVLMALAATVDAGSGHRLRRNIALAAAFGTAAYLLRPGLLPMIGALPLLLWLDAPGLRRRATVAAALLTGLAAPFAVIATLRLATLGDWNIVSFGGFQMSGIAALMLTPAAANRLPPAMQTAARDITRRDALIAAGRALPLPLNSAGERSFASAALGYFDLLARTYDDVLYGAVRPTQRPGESWVAFNGRMQALSLATIRAQPVNDAAWVAGATGRLVGHMLVFNPAMDLAALLLLTGVLRRNRLRPGRPGELRTLAILSAVYTAGASALVVLTTFPAGRYIDGAGMMIAAVPLYVGLRLLPGLPARRAAAAGRYTSYAGTS